MFVKEEEINVPITKMTVWKSAKGFDYLALASEERSIITAEVYYLNFKEIRTKLNTTIISLEYNEKMGRLLYVTEDGRVFSDYYLY